MLGLVKEDKVGGIARLKQPDIEVAFACGVAGGKAEGDFGRDVAERGQQRNHAQDAQGLDTGTGRPVGAENDPVQLVKFPGGVEGEEGRAFIAVVDDFETFPAGFAETDDLLIRQSRMTAIDMPDHIGAGFQDNILVNQARAGDRGTAGVDRALHAVLAGPVDHLAGCGTILDRAEADFAEKPDTGFGQGLEILLLHAVFDDGCSGQHLDSRGSEIFVPALGRNRHGFQADDVLWPARHVDLASGNHRRHTPVECRVDPVQLVLPGGVISDDRMDMAIDESGGQSHASGINDGIGTAGVEVGRESEGVDRAINGNNAVPVEDGVFDFAGEDQSDIPDDQFAAHDFSPSLLRCGAVDAVTKLPYGSRQCHRGVNGLQSIAIGAAQLQHLGISMIDTVEDSSEPQFSIPKGVFCETVTFVKHYTDRLFAFRITRPASFRFRSGEFVMIGLPNAERPVYRAYSIACPNWDEELEFYSIKVPDGPLTQHLQKIVVGDRILMRPKPTGTLVNDALLGGQRLWLFSTGTGIAPFASILRDPETYEKFNTVILTHTCRAVAELQYGVDLVAATREDPLVGEEAGAALEYIATTTQEASPVKGRITNLLTDGTIMSMLAVPELNPSVDRCMICGSMGFLQDTKAILDEAGFTEGSNSAPGDYVIERAFVG